MIIGLFRKKSIVLKWILSYLLVVIVLIGVNIIIYYKSTDIIKKEATEVNQGLLNQVQQAIDNNMKDVKKLALTLAVDDRIKGLMNTDTQLEVKQRYTISQLIKDMSYLSVSNGFIEDFYIYFHNADFVLSTSYYTPDIAYETFHGNIMLTYEQWKHFISKTYNGEFLVIPSRDDEGKSMIVYADSFPVGNQSKKATLMVILDEDRLYSIIGDYEWINRGAFLIIDQDKRIIGNNDESYRDYIESNINMINKQQDVFLTNINNYQIIVSYNTSQVMDWKYISIIPSEIFLDKYVYVWQLTIYSLIFCLLFGIASAFFFSKKNYKPIKELLNLIHERVHKDESVNNNLLGNNEMTFIKNSIKQVLDEKENNKQKMMQHDQIVRNNYLQRLLQGNIPEERLIKKELLEYGVDFSSEWFQVALFKVEDATGFLNSGHNESKIEGRNLTQFVLENVLRELLHSDYNCYVFELDNIFAAIINQKSGQQDKAESDLKNFILQMKSIFQTQIGITFTASLSSTKKTVFNISAAYRQAQDVLEYKQVIGNFDIITYNEIQGSNNRYQYSMEMEHQLINFIKAGDFDKARGIIEYIFKTHFSKGLPSINVAKCLLFDLVGTLVKAFDSVSEEFNNEVWEKIDPVDRLISCQTVQEMKYEMEKLLGEVCGYINQNRKNQHEERKDIIVAYINKNFKNPNLNINMIADHIGLNSAYLSREFKNQTGEGLLNYINKFRVKKAKELLKEKNMSILDAAKLVGYQNSVALIRAFKKHEGITPGQYKDMA